MNCFIQSAGRQRDYNIKPAPENGSKAPLSTTLDTLVEFSRLGLVGKKYPGCAIVRQEDGRFTVVVVNIMLDGFFDEHNRQNRMALMVEGLSDNGARAIAVAYIENRVSFTERFVDCIDRETIYQPTRQLDYGINRELSPIVQEIISAHPLPKPDGVLVPKEYCGQEAAERALLRKSLDNGEPGLCVRWAEGMLCTFVPQKKEEEIPVTRVFDRLRRYGKKAEQFIRKTIESAEPDRIAESSQAPSIKNAVCDIASGLNRPHMVEVRMSKGTMAIAAILGIGLLYILLRRR